VQTNRIESIDIFRGLTILVMIFVNSAAGVKGLPWWNYHMPPGVNGMTYVDVVFPAFLFIVGMAIPLALERRIAAGDSRRRLCGHIALRSAGLLVLGLFLANSGKMNAELTGMSRGAWRRLAFAAILLTWAVYPKSQARRWLFRGMQGAGFLLLVSVLLLFRRSTGDGQAAWLDFSYWEILGLIGWTYLAVSILYLLLRGRPWALASSLALLCLLNVFSTLRWLAWMGPWRKWWPFGAGLCSIAMAGVVLWMILFDRRVAPKWACGFGVLLLAAGWALSPLGVSKNHATPAWCLLCAGICTLLFLILYWAIDLRGWRRWFAVVRPAGANPLLTYLLPYIWNVIPGLAAFAGRWRAGAAGAIRCLVFTAVMLAAAAVLTRMKVRLRL
jgi:predicted acyltransferase